MANEEHKKLADFIKSVHHELRYQSNQVGAAEAWKAHCSQQETLGKYAIAMTQLATEYWDPNADDENRQAKSRIEWVARHSQEYFMSGGKLKERQKEDRKWKVYQQINCHDKYLEEGILASEEEFNYSRPSLLDVGSCYNPFKRFEFLNVLPIDIAPASKDVYKCDFLNTNISSVPDTVIERGCPITELRECSFDIIVFSLLLEYMPTPEQRYQCCLKAYKLLKFGGLLFIITPDSKHSSANAPLMKNWRICLSHIGLFRVYYEKLAHIHCMAYRKAAHSELAQRLWLSASITTTPELLMKIPQDFQECILTVKKSNVERTAVDNEDVTNLFCELPLEI